MANVSTARKLSVLARVAAQQAGRSRSLSALFAAGRATAAHVLRLLHQLWLEIMGFLFLAIAAIGGFAFMREYPRFQAGQIGSGRLLVTAGFTLVFAWFGLTSFWRAWKRGESLDR
jgi:protein-S-isoprenylcysteine O-methyltransferase Ste14